MPSLDQFIYALGLMVLAAPVALMGIMGVSSLLDRQLSERATGRVCQAAIVVGLLSAVAILTLMLATGATHVPIDLGNWVAIEHHSGQHGTAHAHYHFLVKIVFDRLSIPFVILSYLLCGTISAFAVKYMHRERGYNRFFALYALFLLGMVITSVAGTIETLFTGWEMVGLSSALLIAFFQERPAPVRNGLSVWIVYRVSDAALLLAAVVMHHMSGEGDFDKLLGSDSWPDGHAAIGGRKLAVVGFLLVVAAAGKSALVPFSGWLPRAMEGPTPSSAVFYGALSVHLGAFLLLRISPIFDANFWLSVLVVVLGLTTALFAYLAGSVQTDIKSALSFASLAQVGIIVAEIGFGLRYLALVHLLGHACLRTLQFVRAPSLLQDYRALENAIGDRLPRSAGPFGGLIPLRWRSWLYLVALERGYLDAFLSEYIVRPFIKAFRLFDSLEHRWTEFLAGRPGRRECPIQPIGRIEELP